MCYLLSESAFDNLIKALVRAHLALEDVRDALVGPGIEYDAGFLAAVESESEVEA